MMQLKPYPKYKDSGVEWLGELPESWSLRRTKTLLLERNEKGYPDQPLLAATQTKGVIKKDKYESRTVVAQNNLHLLKLAMVDDFVISLRSFQGGIERAYDQGIISPAYTVLCSQNKDHINYLSILFKSRTYIDNLKVYVTGIREGQNIDYVKLSRSYLPFPPTEEQSLIVRYLNYINSRISKYIIAKKKLIKLLEEQKQAIIHQAVTGAIDVRTGKPYPIYKESGVEWLGKIPEEWETRKLKYLTQNINIQTSEKTKEELYIALENVESWTGKIINLSPDVTFDSKVKRFKKNDVLFGKLRPYLAKVVQMQQDGVCVGEFLVLRTQSKLISSHFLEILLRSKKTIDVIDQSTFGAKMPRADWGFIGGLLIAYPGLAVQKDIVNFIKVQNNEMNLIVDKTQKEIELLQEYRTRLTADVVTGKVDVRDFAKNLPEEIEEFDVDLEEEVTDGNEDISDVEENYDQE